MYDCSMLYKILISLVLCLCTWCSLLHAKEDFLHKEITLQLKEPEYHDGIISSQHGGIVQGEGFRLQGEHITYTKQTQNSREIHKITAEGSLMLDYHGQIFVGDYLEYDFLSGTGYVLQGKTSIGVWWVSGKKILLHADKSFEVLGAAITTSEDNQAVWEMTAETVRLSQDDYLSTKNIQFRVLNMPVFWIPSFKTNLNRSNNETPLRYALSWDAGQGPQISFRYRVYSWEGLELFLRADYRYARGPGGAVEMDYISPDQITRFQSKNYIAHDTFYKDDKPNKKRTRFRLQGLYTTHSKDGKGHLDVVYDKISDKNLPGDFKPDDFELSTEKQTKVTARYLQHHYIAGFNVKPRINPFDGFKQELPVLKMNVKALKLGSSPFVLNNQFNLAYLNYVYSNQLVNMPPNIAAVLKDFHSVRVETHQELLLPLRYQSMTLTPNAGLIGILYNNSPTKHSANQLVITYGADLNAQFSRRFALCEHVAMPYVKYIGINHPLKNYHEVYIFDINDGYHRLNMLKLGINNFFYGKHSSPFLPTVQCDLYALGFLADKTFRIPFPKAGIVFGWHQSNLRMSCDVRWNFNNHVLDFSNLALGYTVNANIALNLEFRHRSRFDWRKDNHQNFILDVTQPIPELLDSPLSDGRNVLLTKAEVKLTPTWLCRIQMHNGWGRKNQPGYTEAKVDLLGLLSSAWRLKLSYMYTTRGASHFGVGLDLVK